MAFLLDVGCRFFGEDASPELHEIYGLLREPTSYPIGLTFARPNQVSGSRWAKSALNGAMLDVESSETIAVAAESFGELGCVFESKHGTDIVVTDLYAVPGPFQIQMDSYVDANGRVHLSIDAVNGEFTPSYATANMVMNALKRKLDIHWSLVEILFCDDEEEMGTKSNVTWNEYHNVTTPIIGPRVSFVLVFVVRIIHIRVVFGFLYFFHLAAISRILRLLAAAS